MKLWLPLSLCDFPLIILLHRCIIIFFFLDIDTWRYLLESSYLPKRWFNLEWLINHMPYSSSIFNFPPCEQILPTKALTWKIWFYLIAPVIVKQDNMKKRLRVRARSKDIFFTVSKVFLIHVSSASKEKKKISQSFFTILIYI